jgi:hypothetical protein
MTLELLEEKNSQKTQRGKLSMLTIFPSLENNLVSELCGCILKIVWNDQTPNHPKKTRLHPRKSSCFFKFFF